MFGDLRAAALITTWFLRIVGFVLMWTAFSLIVYPIEWLLSFTEYIPTFVGDILEGIADLIVCLIQLVTFFVSVGWSLFVIALAWVAVRPLFGIPLFIFCVGIITLTLYLVSRKG